MQALFFVFYVRVNITKDTENSAGHFRPVPNLLRLKQEILGVVYALQSVRDCGLFVFRLFLKGFDVI